VLVKRAKELEKLVLIFLTLTMTGMFCRSTVVFLCFLVTIRSFVAAFAPPRHVLITKTAFRALSRLESSSADNDSAVLPTAAKAPLLWETIEARESKPVLNLSKINKDITNNDQQQDNNDDIMIKDSSDSWQTTTRTKLKEMGVIQTKEDEEKLLKAVPQLLRLDTSIVLDSCQAVVDLFNDTAILVQEPRLLSFRGDDLRYAIEFLSIMMACPKEIVMDTCRSNPKLLLGGAEGGLQEQAVKRALGAAGAATNTANKRIASNAAASLQSLKQRKPPGI